MSPRHRFDVVLNNLVAWAVTTGRIHLKSDGTPWRPLVHIEDISRAFLAALEAPREVVHDQAFNVGSEGDNYQVRELAEIVGEVVPGSKVVITGEAGADPRSYRVDFSKIRAALPAYRPEWNARRGAEDLYARYREYGLTLDQVEQRFTRLRWLSQLQATNRLTESLQWLPGGEPQTAGVGA